MIAVVKSLLFYWKNPLANGIDFDSPEAVGTHQRIIDTNPILRACYHNRYKRLTSVLQTTRKLSGQLVEIGSGAGYLEKYIPGLIKTDVIKHSNIDQVVNAEEVLPFADESVRVFFLVAVLHHLSKPALFFAEAERCLMSGGRIVLIEGGNTPVSRLVFKHLLPYEYFDSTITHWENNTQGRLDHANSAVPWVILERDKELFHQKFPKLKIVRAEQYSFIFYFVSGGLSYRPFIPAVFLPLIKLVERLAHPFRKWLSTEVVWEIEKL